MFIAIFVVHIIVSLVLIGVVLLQTGKGASMGAVFGGASSQTLFGSAGPATFLGKVTAACAIIFMITSMSLTYLTATAKTSSVMEDIPIKEVPAQKEDEKANEAKKTKEATETSNETTPPKKEQKQELKKKEPNAEKQGEK